MEIKTEHGTIRVSFHHYNAGQYAIIGDAGIAEVPQWGQEALRAFYAQHPNRESRKWQRKFGRPIGVMPSLYVRGLTLCLLMEILNREPGGSQPGGIGLTKFGYAFCSARGGVLISADRRGGAK